MRPCNWVWLSLDYSSSFKRGNDVPSQDDNNKSAVSERTPGMEAVMDSYSSPL